MTSLSNLLKRVARGIYARAVYLNLQNQINTLVLYNRTKEAHRLSRHRRRLRHILYEK